MRRGLLLFVFFIPNLLLFSQEMGTHTRKYNFTSFSENKKVSSQLLDGISSVAAKEHPEYGILPYDAQCTDCIELIDKRNASSRQYIDPKKKTHTYSQQSYFPLHYMDIVGRWRTIDHRLRPLPEHPGVYTAPDQPMPVRFDLAAGYTSIDLHYFELIYNKGLKMYFSEDTNGLPIGAAAADFSSYTTGDDGARVYNIWPGIDMEAFAKNGLIETNFIILSKPVLPISKGYLVIEDHVIVPDGYTLEHSSDLQRLARLDLVLKNKKGDVLARMEHVRLRNAANEGLATRYIVQREPGGYLLKMLIPYSFLNTNATNYPIVMDPVVYGTVDTGNYQSSHNTPAGLKFTTLPGHCDYHLVDTVPGMSQLLGAFFSIEDETTSDVHCGDTLQSDGGAFGHVCLMREMSNVLICDTCHVISGRIQCVNVTVCDTPGTSTTDSVLVRAARPIAIPHTFISCLPPQCPDYHIGWTLQKSDSSCEDQCGQLCARGNLWSMTVEACQIDAYITASPTVCAGQPVTLTCYASCGVPPYHYLWSNNMTGRTITIYPARDVIIGCTAYDTCGNYALTNDTTIRVIPSPPASAGPDMKLCEGGTITIGGSPTTSTNTTITWTSPDGTAQSWISDPTIANPSVNVPHGTIDTVLYVVRADSGGCFRTDTMAVFSIPDPMAIIDTTGSTHICNGQSVTLQANGPFHAYLWNNGATTQSTIVSAPGPYYVVVTDSNSCTDTSNVITVSQIEVPNIHIYPDTLIFYGDSVMLYADVSLTPPAVDSFFWSPDTTISCITCPQPIVAPLSAQEYMLTVYTQGCVLTDSTLIRVVLPNNYYIPNAFTPNGDGVNDSFYVYSQSGVTVTMFRVFDRWGEKVHDGTYPWDGQYKGRYCEPGVYAYIFSLSLFGKEVGVETKGSVTLIK